MPGEPIKAALNPRICFRLLGAWQFLLLAAVPVAILTAATGIDFVRPIHGLIYLFMAGIVFARPEQDLSTISVSLGRQVGGLFGALALLAFVRIWSAGPTWLDGVVLLGAAALVLSATSSTGMPRLARKFLQFGLVLQAAWTIAILYDPFYWRPRHSYLVNLYEFLFLAACLLALILDLMSRSAPLARQDQVRVMREATNSAEAIHAAHLAYACRLLAQARFGGNRAASVFDNILRTSGPWSLAETCRWSFRLGPSIRRRVGKSLARQAAEQIGLAYRHGIPAKYYYVFELFRPDLMRRAGDYLQRGETKYVVYKMLRGKTETRIKDKLAFARRCAERGVRAVPVILTAENGIVDFGRGETGRLPSIDLFVKPQKASGGRGAEKWQALPEGRFRSHDGRLMDEVKLIESIADGSRAAGLIVQPLLVNHPDLTEVNCGTLATVRLVTLRNETGGYEAVCAAFRMPRHAGMAVDNFHAGGIAASVDLATGELGQATDLGIRGDSQWYANHPVGGTQIAGRKLPFWTETKALAQSAHAEFPAFPIIGWDIGILSDGPCIVEANSAPDLDIIQRTALMPLGRARLGALLAWHLRQAPPSQLLGEI
jgi:Sugar-transfer associated ATP-grasp